MAENTIGDAWVAIRPDLSGFSNALETGTATALGKLNTGVLTVGASVFALGSLALGLSSKFQSSLTMIEGRMNITAAAGNAIGAAFLSTAGKATFSAVTIAQAFAPVSGQLEQINKGALTAGQSLTFMNSAMQLAEATGQPLADVTATLAGILQTFGMNLNAAGTASNILYNASSALGVPLDTLATNLDRARTNAGAASPSLSDLATLLLDLAENGETGRGALTVLSTALTGIEDPSAKVLEAQKKLNLSFLTANGQLKPFSSIIGQLNPLLSTMGNAQQVATLKSLGFGSASTKLVGIIDAGLPSWDQANKKVNTSASVATAASKNTNTLAGAWDTFSSSVSDMLTKSGTPLNTFLTNVVNWLTKHLQPAVFWIINNWPIWSKILIPLVAAWGTWNAIAIGGKIVTMLTGVGSALGIIGDAGLAAGVTASVAPLLGLGVASFTGLIELLNVINPTGSFAALHGYSPREGPSNFDKSLGRTTSSAPPRAGGGSVFAGMGYMVGEMGPELFRPSQNGTIIPNHALSAAGGITMYNSYYGVSEPLIDMIDQRQRVNNSQLIRQMRAARR